MACPPVLNLTLLRTVSEQLALSAFGELSIIRRCASSIRISRSLDGLIVVCVEDFSFACKSCSLGNSDSKIPPRSVELSGLGATVER
mmetsp:Transcript_17700/g.35549  ORF Transcript_17700/g.35549 Transcript_17700/m.35549 type:complete len:87 (+) Transcript_17700:1123-1383(+)